MRYVGRVSAGGGLTSLFTHSHSITPAEEPCTQGCCHLYLSSMQMRVRSLLPSSLSVAALLILAAGAPKLVQAAATLYVVSPNGNDTSSIVSAMSPDGTIVAGQSVNNSSVTPITWTVAGNTTTPFVTTAGATNVIPAAINDEGTDVLITGSATSSVGPVVPFLYNGTSFLQLSINKTASNATGARATGMANPAPNSGNITLIVNGFDNNGALTGNLFYATNLTTGNYGTSTKTQAGGFFGISSNATSLAYLDAGNSTAAIYDNNNPTNPNFAPAFGSVTSGNITGNFVSTGLNGISTNGQYVFGVANTSFFGRTYQRGFIFDSSGNTSTIVDPRSPTDAFGTIRGVSQGGYAVGISGPSSSFSNETAVFVDPVLGTFGLKNLLEVVYGTDLTGWNSLNEARAISDDGLTIAGVGNFSGNQTGFVIVLDSLPDAAPDLAIIDQPVSQTVSVLSNVTLSVSAVPGQSGGDLSYQWNFEAAPIANATSQSLTLTKVDLADAGNYTVVVTNATTNVTSNIAVLTVTGNAAASPGFYRVDSLSGNISDETVVTAMSPDGQIVAGQNVVGSTVSPITWTLRGNTTAAFADTAGSANILPTDISNAGPSPLIVGNATISNSNTTVIPFLYNGTKFLPLSINGTAASSTAARATGLADPSNTSVVIAINGQAGNTTSGNIFSTDLATGNYISSGHSQGGGISGVSRNGNVLGYLQTTPSRSAVQYIVSSNTPNPSPLLGSQTSGSITGNFVIESVSGISADGRYVFGAANTTVPGQTYHRGYLYTAPGNIVLLAPNHPADVFASCLAVSNNGVGVGMSAIGSGNTAVLGNETAVVYHPTLGTLGLKNLLVNVYGLGGNIGDLTLSEARSISEDGTVISGVGLEADGITRRGFVVLLPSSVSNISVANLTIIEQPSAQSPLINGNVTFSVTALAGNTSTGTLAYQWYLNGQAIAGATGSDLILTNVQESANGNYTVKVSDSVQFTNSSAALLSVINNLPIITSQPKAVNNVKLGGNLTLSVTASNAVSYQWNFANATTSFFINGATNRTYTAKNISLIMVGNYTCNITNGNGTVISNIAVVNALYPPKVTKQPVAVTIKPGKLLRLTVTATGYPPPHYQWYQNNRLVTKKTGNTSTYQVKPAHQPDSGSYRVKVSNSQGFAYSKWVVVSVAPKTGGGNTTGGNTTGG